MSVDYVIQHAAPTLAGIKTGNLFPCFFSSPQAMVRDLRAINNDSVNLFGRIFQPHPRRV